MAIAASMHLGRRHADRAARPCSRRDALGQQLVDAVAHDRMGLAAADLHDRPGPRGDARDRVGVAARQRRVAELVDVFHAQILRLEFGQIGKRLERLRLVDDGDGEAGMDQHVVADLRLRHIGEVGLLDDAGEGDPALRGSADRRPRCSRPARERRGTSDLLLDQRPRGEDGLADGQPAVVGRDAMMPIGRKARRAQAVDRRSVSRAFWKQPPVSSTLSNPDAPRDVDDRLGQRSCNAAASGSRRNARRALARPAPPASAASRAPAARRPRVTTGGGSARAFTARDRRRIRPPSPPRPRSWRSGRDRGWRRPHRTAGRRWRSAAR